MNPKLIRPTIINVAPKPLKTAQEEGERIITGARAEIDQELNRAKEELRSQVSTLALAGAEKILDKEIDKKAHVAMLAKLAKDL